MKLAKQINGTMNLVEVEDGHEVGGDRTEQQLYDDGYKKACLTEKPSETATEEWNEYPSCWVQSWNEPQEEQEDFTDEEALDIIMGGAQ